MSQVKRPRKDEVIQFKENSYTLPIEKVLFNIGVVLIHKILKM